MKKTHKILVILTLLGTAMACTKIRFPKKEKLIGTWIEETSRPFKHKLVFDNETLFFYKSKSIDTLLYRLDKEEKQILFSLKSMPSAGESAHRININLTNKSIVIDDLFITVGFQDNSGTFKKQ